MIDALNLKVGTDRLAEAGLNVFASLKVRRLPKGLVDHRYDDLTLCLIGHGGRKLWTQLNHPLKVDQHPIDQYTMKAVAQFSSQTLKDDNVIILYPSDQFVAPLQRMGRALQLTHQSLLGIDIHQQYGLWFAYRCALLTKADIPEVLPSPFRSPCEDCQAKPCQTACPASAVGQTGQEFKLSSCIDYRRAKTSSCVDRCLSRLACPVGQEHRYTPEQLRYHMTGLVSTAKI